MADYNRNRKGSSYYQDQDWDDYDRQGRSYNDERNYGDEKGKYESGRYSEGRYDRYPEYNREDYGNYGSGRVRRYGRDYERDHGTTSYRGGQTGYRDYDMGYSSPYYGHGSPYSGVNRYGSDYGDYSMRAYGNRGIGVRGFDGNRSYGDRSYQGYGGDYDRRQYDRDRDWWDRTRDEVSSWFGDEEAEHRRRMDKVYGKYKGKGPKGYRRTDERIREDINDRLSDDPYIDATEVLVSVDKGEVTLTGTVDSRMSKRRAEDIAESVSGVSHIENRLRVSSRAYSEADLETISGSTSTIGSERSRRQTDEQ